MLASGIDIGGVNIKVARCRQAANELMVETVSIPFETAHEAAETLRLVLDDVDLVVATETVSFSRSSHRTFHDGVAWTCDILEKAFGHDRVRLMGLDYDLLTLDEARQEMWRVACRNWVGSTYLVAHHLQMLQNGLLIDCGTSSLDVIPVVDGCPVALDGDDDQVWTRLATGELTLTGSLLTSVQAFASTVTIGDRTFSTRSNAACLTGHARVVTGDIRVSETVPDASDVVLTPSRSRRMLCELVGADETLLSDAELRLLARGIVRAQEQHVAAQVERVRERAAQQLGRPFDQAVLVGLGARPLLAPALKDTSLHCQFADETLASWLAPESRIESNCETALGASLMAHDTVARELAA